MAGRLDQLGDLIEARLTLSVKIRLYRARRQAPSTKPWRASCFLSISSVPIVAETRVVDEGSALVGGGAGVAEEQAINNDARVTTVQIAPPGP